jgi:RHS repeat-associated protein
MGYYYTTSPENAVPGKSWGMPKMHVPASPVKERGHRYYQSEIGRWLSRDPIGEKGFRVRGLMRWRPSRVLSQSPNIYSFCGNAAIDQYDLLGLMSQSECEWTAMTTPIDITPPGWEPGECSCVPGQGIYSEGGNVPASTGYTCAATISRVPCSSNCRYDTYFQIGSTPAYVKGWSCKWLITCLCTKKGETESHVVDVPGGISGEYPVPPTTYNDPIKNSFEAPCGTDWKKMIGCPGGF